MTSGGEDQGPVPKEEINEDSITNFDKGAGDSSKALLWVILAAAALALIGIMFFTDAPSGEGGDATPSAEGTR